MWSYMGLYVSFYPQIWQEIIIDQCCCMNDEGGVLGTRDRMMPEAMAGLSHLYEYPCRGKQLARFPCITPGIDPPGTELLEDTERVEWLIML